MSDIFLFNVDAIELKKAELKLGSLYKKAPIAIMRALNRAADSVRTKAVKEVTQNYYVKAKDARGTIKIYRASRSKLGAQVVSTGNLIPLDHFKFSPTKPNPKNPPKNIRVAVKKGELKTLLHAFVADVNGVKIFERVGLGRLPIRRIQGPAIPQMIRGSRLQAAIEQESKRVYQDRLDHEIKRLQEGNK